MDPSQGLPVSASLYATLRQLDSSVYLQAEFMRVGESKSDDFVRHSYRPFGASILGRSRTAEIFCPLIPTLAFNEVPSRHTYARG